MRLTALVDLRLRLLGPPEIIAGGVPLRVDSRKGIAILAYVGLEGPQPRGTLDALLWPHSDAKRARGALRRTLTALRQALPPGSLAAGDDVALAVPVATDVVEVKALLESIPQPPGTAEIAALMTGRDAHAGRFLEGLHFRDAEPFQQWCDAIDAQVQRRQVTLLEKLCRACVVADDLEGAVDAAVDRLRIDVLHEPSHQQLMLLYAWQGDRARATEQYRTCLRLLDEELGVAPLARTTQMFRAIQDGTIPPRRPGVVQLPPTPSPTLRPAPAARPLPLVGRNDELAGLMRKLDGARGSGRVAVVRGEAGIGKSRLLDELMTAARAAGSATLHVQPQPGDGSVAYAPLLAPLRRLLDEHPGVPAPIRHEVERLLPAMAHDTGVTQPLGSPIERTRFLDAVCSLLLLGLRGEQPGLLVVDDFDIADGETRQLLGYLATQLHGQSVLVVAAWRLGSDHAADAERALGSEVAAVDLARLDEAAVSRLAGQAGAADDADRLYAETEGVPFLVVSYLAGRSDRDDWTLPDSSRDLVRSRLSPVSELARQVLAGAAILGRSTDLATLAQVTGRSDDEVADALEELCDRQLLAEFETEGGEVGIRFTHDKIRSVAHDETSLARRRLLHGRAADVLRSRHGLPAARLAQHLLLAGREAEAAQAHAEAGRRAASLYANVEAREHFEAALGLDHPSPSELLVELGDVLVRLGHYGDAEHHYTRALSRRASPAVVEHRLGALCLRGRDLVRARTHLLAALQAVDAAGDAGAAARIRADLALALLLSDEAEDALVEARRAQALAADSEDAHALARSHNLLAVLARRMGDVVAAQEHARASLGVANGSEEERIASLNNLALAAADAGDLDGAMLASREAADAGQKLGDRHRMAALLNNLADILHASGEIAEAQQAQRAAAEAFSGVGIEAITQPEIWQLVDW